MTIRDWVELVLLVVLMLTGIGRWIETRASKGDVSKTERDEHTAAHAEHERIWKEIERNRRHWHEDMVPFQQKLIERLAMVETSTRGLGEELTRIRSQMDRRRLPRD